MVGMAGGADVVRRSKRGWCTDVGQVGAVVYVQIGWSIYVLFEMWEHCISEDGSCACMRVFALAWSHTGNAHGIERMLVGIPYKMFLILKYPLLFKKQIVRQVPCCVIHIRFAHSILATMLRLDEDEWVMPRPFFTLPWAQQHDLSRRNGIYPASNGVKYGGPLLDQSRKMSLTNIKTPGLMLDEKCMQPI